MIGCQDATVHPVKQTLSHKLTESDMTSSDIIYW